MSSTTLYTSHILPARPAHPLTVLSPAAASTLSDTPKPDVIPIDIKHSSYKTLSAFLKSVEKSGLITLKSPPKKSTQTDLFITAVNFSHKSVLGLKSYLTVQEMEVKAAKKAEREQKEKEGGRGGGVEVRELWKPQQANIELFESMQAKFVFYDPTLHILSPLNAH
jgi:translation initiation factor 2D